MATAPSYIGARVLRVTRLDMCGRPVYGDCSQVVTDGFVSVEISPEVEEGENYTLRNAAGDLCVSERGQDSLQWFTVSIEFCRVDPALFSLMNPTWKIVRNAQGEPTGFRVGTKFTDREGFALELWPKAASAGVLCPEDAPEDAEPNGYFLLPYVLGTAPDAMTFEDGVATFSLNGRTKGGSLWGRGPYNITHDINGNPTPLLEPIDSGADTGDPDHFHTDIVTLAPPTAEVGCQPLEAITPGVAGGELSPDADQPNRVCAEITGSAGRQVTVDWGDGSDPVTSRVGREECHLYTETGTYTVTVADIDDPEKSATYDVTIDEIPPLPEPSITVTPSSGTAPLAVQLSVNNHGNGQVTLDWGDGTTVGTVDGGGDDDIQSYPHQYAEPGEFTITVTAVDDDRAVATTEVTVLSTDPVVSVTPTEGDAPLQVSISVDNHGNGIVNLDFGDESETGTNPGNGTATTSHTFTEPGTYEIVATSQADDSSTGSETVVVNAPEVEEPEVAADETEGQAPFEASIMVNNHDNGPVSVDFGDGSDPTTNPGDGETATTHTYADPGEYTVTATSEANPEASGTVTITATGPDAEAPVVTATPTEGETPLEVAFTVDNHGNGPVQVSFGDGSEAVSNAGDGEAETTHTYDESGTYTVTATSDADTELSGTTTVTVTDPTPPPSDPVVTATPAEGEAPLDIVVTVDNHDGGPVSVDFGDGSEAVSNAGDGEAETTHTYDDAGAYTVTATSEENTDRSGTAPVTVTAPDPQVPDAPTGVIVTDPTTEGFTVGWDWTQGEGAEATGFAVSYRTPPGDDDVAWSDPITADADATSVDVTGLDAETDYDVRVVATGAEGDSDPVTAEGSTV